MVSAEEAAPICTSPESAEDVSQGAPINEHSLEPEGPRARTLRWFQRALSALDPLAHTPLGQECLEESIGSGGDVHGVVDVPSADGPGSLSKTLRTMRAYAGPGLLIAVGYMDPGNWSTGLYGGSGFGYDLLCVIVLSNFVGCLLQHLAVRLGAGVSRDLAQACREYYPRPVARLLWVLAECAIAATDLAEVLGSAIALDILFGLPLLAGVLITAADVLLLLLLNGQNARTCEALVFCLMAIIATCLIFTLVQAGAPVGQVMQGLIPKRRILTNSNELYAAIGIMGATVMPHNLFLHSSLVQSRRFMKDAGGRWQAISYGTVDGTVSLFLAMFINAAILVVAAAAFYGKGPAVEDIHEAVSLLAPALGSAAASTLFAVGLLAAGQQSTLTGTLAGQIVLEGFMGTSVALKPWARRLATRMVAIVPAVAVAASSGAEGVSKLLTLSQVVLSLALPFCMFPLVHFTGSRAIMGDFVAPRPLRALCWLIFLCITALNGKLLYDFSTEDA